MKTPIRIIPQGEIASGTGEPPALLLPNAKSYFTDRASRFASLAASGHADAPYLSLMERLSHAQQAALDAHPEPAAIDAAKLELCHRHGLPPVPKDAARDGAWREALAIIIEALLKHAPPPAQACLSELKNSSAAQLETLADRLLAFDYPALNAAMVPFLGAALQVHWVKRVYACGVQTFRKLDIPGICPACGSPPVSSVLRIDIPVPGARYLCCTLCGTNWHLLRGQCTQCEARDNLSYYHIEGENVASKAGAIKAEACDECHGYVKILNREQDPLADPVADDLATLALDVLMDDSGYERASPNLLFAAGQN
ncbi:MAG: formate dehydrogenase accessory protein FdhE [Burkholderiales bacterium]